MLYQALLSTKDVNAVILDFERAHKEVSHRRASNHRIPSPPVEEAVERTPSRVPSPPAADLLGLFSPLSPLETYLAGKSGTYVGVPLRSPPVPPAAVPSSVPVAPPVPQPAVTAPKKSHKAHHRSHKRRGSTPSSRSSSSSGSSSSDRSQIARRKDKKASEKGPKAGVKLAVQPVAPNGGAVKKVVKKVMVAKKATPAGSTVAASKPSTPKLAATVPPTSVSPQPLKPTIHKTSSTPTTQQQQQQQQQHQPQKDFVDNFPFQSQVAVSPGRAFRNQPYQQSTPPAPSPTMEPSQFKRLLLSAGMVVPSGSGGYTASPDGSLAPQDRYMDAPNTSVRKYPNHSGVSQMSERALRTESEQPANSYPTNSVPTFPSAPNITAYFSTGHGSTVTPLVTHWSQPALFINREVPTVYRPANAISVPIQPDHNQVLAPTPQQSYPEASYPYSAEPVYSSSPQRRAPILSPPTEDTVAPYHHVHAPPPPVLRERDSAVAVSPGRYSRGHRLLSPKMGGEPKEAPPPKRMFC